MGAWRNLLAGLLVALGLACAHDPAPPLVCPEGPGACAPEPEAVRETQEAPRETQEAVRETQEAPRETQEASRETRARVERADRARKRAAFSEQVERWRSALLAKTSSAGASASPRGEAPPPEAAELGAGPPEGLDELVAAVRRAPSRAPSRPPSRLQTERPPPEVLLLGAACLLERDLPLLEARVREARLERRRAAPALALSWVDARDLAARVDAARAERPPDCTRPKARAALALARALVGPPPETAAALRAHLRGLERLERELITHADLGGARAEGGR